MPPSTTRGGLVRSTLTLRRVLTLVLVALLALLGDAVVTATSNPAAAAITETPVPNPPLPATCGLKIAIVFDLSLSVDATDLRQMKTAANSIVTELTGTPSQIGVYTFATYAPAFNGYNSGAPAGNASLNAVSIAAPAGANQVHAHINGLARITQTNAGYTNWQAGLAQVRGLGYDKVLFVTDGDPTANGTGSSVSTNSNINNVRDADVNPAIAASNTLKNAGTRVVAIGIGTSGTASINRLKLITNGDASVAGSDYFVTDFEDLGQTLADAATKTCRGTVTVTKLVRGLDGTDTPQAGWTFHATSDHGAADPASAQTDGKGVANFVIPSSGDQSSTASFYEIQQDGHRLIRQTQETAGGGQRNATCRADESPIPVTDVDTTAPRDAGFQVAVAPTSVVTCTVINEVIPAHLTLRKVVHNLTPDRAQPEYWTLHANGPSTLSGNDTGDGVSANVRPGTYTLSETADASLTDAYTASAWACTGTGVNQNGAQVTLADDANATCTITNTEKPRVQLVQGKTVDRQIAQTGDDLTYTLSISNTGTGDATGVSATDTLPDGVTFVSADHGGTESGGVVTWNGLTIPAGGSLTLQVVVTVTASAPAGEQITLINRFQVTPPPDTPPVEVQNPCEDNDEQSCAETVVRGPDPQPELTQSKAVDLTTAGPGDTLTYTMQVYNTGNTSLSGVTATDTLPDGVTYVSSTATQGSFDPDTAVWTIPGPLDSGASATLTITVTVNADAESTTLINRFKINTPTTNVIVENECDDDATSSCAETEVPGVPRLTLNKTVDRATASAGDTLTYTITLQNTGTADATDVIAQDTMPENTTYVSADTHGHGTFHPSTGAWHVGTITAGDTARLTLRVTITADAEASTLVNRVGVILPPDEPNPPTVENPCEDNDLESCAETVVPGVPRLTQSKVVDQLVAKPGDTLTYTMTVTNTGTAAATGVVAHDTVPDGVSPISSNTHGAGTYDAGSGAWHIGTIDVGQTVVLTITARLHGGTENTLQTDRFVVTPPTEGPPPVVDQPCIDDESASCATTEVHGTPAIVQDKTVDRQVAAVGDRITYTLTVANHGTGAALNTVARDILPAGVSLVSSNTGGLGVFDADGLTWTLPLLEAGVTARATLVVTVQPPAAGQTLTNALQVTPPPESADTVVKDPCPSAPDQSCASTDVAASEPLANTGGNIRALSEWALLLLVGGAALLVTGRRRWQH